jgi:GNAT superfamily N-acetyltransferase
MNENTPAFDDWAIRLARDQDIDLLCDLLSDCIDDMRSRGIDQWDEIYPSRSTLVDDIQSGTAYLATSNTGQLAGSLVLNDYQNPEYCEIAWHVNNVPTVVVHRLMVHPATQRRGLARFLMRFAEQRALTLGYEAIRLDAFSANPRALRLYEGLGYPQRGHRGLAKGTVPLFRESPRRIGAARIDTIAWPARLICRTPRAGA